MKFAAHPATQGLVDKLVLPDAIQARELLRDHPGGVMIAIAGKASALDHSATHDHTTTAAALKEPAEIGLGD